MTGRESEMARLIRRILVGFRTKHVGSVTSEKIFFVYSAWGPSYLFRVQHYVVVRDERESGEVRERADRAP